MLEEFREFDPDNFEMIVDSPDVLVSEDHPLLMLATRDSRRRAYVLPIGDPTEAARIAAQIRVGVERLWGVKGDAELSDAFMFHGSIGKDKLGRYVPQVHVVDALGKERYFKISGHVFPEFVDMVVGMAESMREDVERVQN